MKDLIVGAADKYTWEQVKPWAVSARECGFEGEVALFVYRCDVERFVEEARQLDIDIYPINTNNLGQPIVHEQKGRDTICHQLRFFHLWLFLSSEDAYNYRYVITTDTRDVIFQRNPVKWLDGVLTQIDQFVAPSEGITYHDEPWGADNLKNGFGPYVYVENEGSEIYNVGTIAGYAPAIRDLSLILYSMGEGRYIPNDQSSFNLLVNGDLFNVIRASHDSGWACQCGTTADPEKIERFRPHLLCREPIFKDGKAYTPDETLYYLLHQWDRVPELKSAICQRYGVNA